MHAHRRRTTTSLGFVAVVLVIGAVRINWTNSLSRTHEFELDVLADASTRDRYGGRSRIPLGCGR